MSEKTPQNRIIEYLGTKDPSLWENITPVLKVMTLEKMTLKEIKDVIEELEKSGAIILPSHVYKLFGTIKSNGAQQTTYYSIDDINVYAKLG